LFYTQTHIDNFVLISIFFSIHLRAYMKEKLHTYNVYVY